jgi:hypothetical protein
VPRRVMCRDRRRRVAGGWFHPLEGGGHSVLASVTPHCLCLLSACVGPLVVRLPQVSSLNLAARPPQLGRLGGTSSS